MNHKYYQLPTYFSLSHLCVDKKIYPYKLTAKNYHNQVTNTEQVYLIVA